MLKNRNASHRSFTVEVKAGGRGKPTAIPSRSAAPAPWYAEAPKAPVAEPRVFAVEPQQPAPEPRRILPSLIEPEPAAFEPEPAPRHGRPRRVLPDVIELVAEPVAEIGPLPAVHAPKPRPVPLKRVASPGKPLPAGERWKRRLNRWSR